MSSIPENLDAQTDKHGRLVYSALEMSRMCGVSRATWWRWVRDCEAPQPIRIGGKRYWTAVDVIRWLRQKDKEIVRIEKF